MLVFHWDINWKIEKYKTKVAFTYPLTSNGRWM